MDNHLSDIFYDTQHLDQNEQIELVDFVFRNGFRWHLDKLDGAERVELKEATKTDVLTTLQDAWHFVVIHRRGYVSWRNNPFFKDAWCGEISFVTNNAYFFGYIGEESIRTLVEKFNLIEMKNEQTLH